jgi:CDP-diacylglycerol--serine O-phosphatidyltransferase
MLLFVQIRMMMPQEAFFLKSILPYCALLIPLSAGVRLAIFNHDKQQSDKFIGLPTPAVGLFIASLLAPSGVALQIFDSIAYQWFFTPRNLAIIAVLLAWLMNARFVLFALKFKGFGWQKNKIRYIFIAFGILMVVLFQAAGIAIILPAYIMVSMVMNHWKLDS